MKPNIAGSSVHRTVCFYFKKNGGGGGGGNASIGSWGYKFEVRICGTGVKSLVQAFSACVLKLYSLATAFELYM